MIDPVCGMTVDPATAKASAEHAGTTYYFCCAGCATKFRANPDQYLKPKSIAPVLVTLGSAKPLASPARTHPMPGGVLESSKRSAPAYVCPMCPEVREAKPGPCPMCGMALDPETPVARIKTEYTCPMHPEIIRAEPGNCPICGMSLEPRTVAAAEEENPELQDMTRRFWVSAILTLPLLAIAMG